jgi:N utilization substance protein A
MKSDFLLAITQLSAEKNLPKEVVLAAVEAALVSAYRKDNFAPTQNLSVRINPTSGRVQVWAEKSVVKKPVDTITEISLDEAQQIKSDAQVDEMVMVEDTPRNAGRIAAQTAKQVILQRLHEAEHSAVFEEYSGRDGEIVSGTVQRIEPRQIFVDLGRTEAILPAAEEVPTERYRIGQRLRAVVLEVARTTRGPRVVLSRSHPDLLRRLFEMEVPEIYNGVVGIKSIAREAGSRSKVAVAALQSGVDPVGCCVGLRGIRIQNIVNELNGEKVDVVMWNEDPSVFIANALSPAQISGVRLNQEEEVATVVVPDRQLSLAIGKEGQNVRLAAKLAGWRIDIKSVSEAEAEKLEEPEPEAVVEEAEEAAAELVVEVKAKEGEAPTEIAEEEIPVTVPAGQEQAATAEEQEEEAEALPAFDSVFTPPSPVVEVEEEKRELRFAEDIISQPAKTQAKKKKKKSTRGKEGDEESPGGRRSRRESDLPPGDEEDY